MLSNLKETTCFFHPLLSWSLFLLNLCVKTHTHHFDFASFSPALERPASLPSIDNSSPKESAGRCCCLYKSKHNPSLRPSRRKTTHQTLMGSAVLASSPERDPRCFQLPFTCLRTVRAKMHVSDDLQTLCSRVHAIVRRRKEKRTMQIVSLPMVLDSMMPCH